MHALTILTRVMLALLLLGVAGIVVDELAAQLRARRRRITEAARRAAAPAPSNVRTVPAQRTR